MTTTPGMGSWGGGALISHDRMTHMLSIAPCGWVARRELTFVASQADRIGLEVGLARSGVNMTATRDPKHDRNPGT